MTKTDSAKSVERKKKQRRSRPKPRPLPPALTFTPYAWAKLLFLRDLGDTEVGGFGISSESDLLLIEDVRLIGQKTTIVTVKFDDIAVADYFDDQVDAGISPERFFRIWLHTHPGNSAQPSGTDEETFASVFGRCDWAVMAILAVGGETYARLRFNAGPGGEHELPVRIDYAQPFPAADPDGWQAEFEHCVRPNETWCQPVESQLDEWDWPWPQDHDEFEFLNNEVLDEYDNFGSLLTTAGSSAAEEAE